MFSVVAGLQAAADFVVWGGDCLVWCVLDCMSASSEWWDSRSFIDLWVTAWVWRSSSILWSCLWARLRLNLTSTCGLALHQLECGLYWTVVVKRELSLRVELLIHWLIYSPTLTFDHKLWILIKITNTSDCCMSFVEWLCSPLEAGWRAQTSRGKEEWVEPVCSVVTWSGLDIWLGCLLDRRFSGTFNWEDLDLATFMVNYPNSDLALCSITLVCLLWRVLMRRF